MTIGLLRNNPCYNGNYNHTISSLGLNTGNLAFWSALETIFNPKRVEYKDVHPDLNERIDKLIITDLIWLREKTDVPYIQKLLETYKGAIVPMSVGLQCGSFKNDFALSNQTVSILKQIEERSIIGVRGLYTADILNKHGIRNIMVIGCPSMYQGIDPDKLTMRKSVTDRTPFVSNFKTFYSPLTQKEKHFLSYCADRKSFFVEQTNKPFTEEQANDKNYFIYITKWLNDNSHIFYNIEDWKSNTERYSFCMGARFHGNVVSLKNGTPSLFLTCDSRTKELTDFFGLPTLELNSFDKTKSLEYYYELADYTEFKKKYSINVDTFLDFLKRNDILRYVLLK